MQDFYFDGTRWLSRQLFVAHSGFAAPDTALAATTLQAVRWDAPMQSGGSDIWIVARQVHWFVTGGTALSASHKWVGTFGPVGSSNALTTIDTATIAAGALTTWAEIVDAIGALLTRSTAFLMATTWTKTGTPGTLLVRESYSYRVVAT